MLSDGPFDEPFHDSFILWFEKLVWHEKIRDSHTYQGAKECPNEFKTQDSWAGCPAGRGACLQDTAPRVSLLGYTTTLEETRPAAGAANTLQCTTQDDPRWGKGWAYWSFYSYIWRGKKNPGRPQFATKGTKTLNRNNTDQMHADLPATIGKANSTGLGMCDITAFLYKLSICRIIFKKKGKKGEKKAKHYKKTLSSVTWGDSPGHS